MRFKKSKTWHNSKQNLISNFEFHQAYETIRANLMFSITKSKCKKIIISSAYSGEGKSTISANIALFLSESKLKVLLIDLDLRKPTIDSIFNLKKINGFSDLIDSNGSQPLTSFVKNIERYPNLDILTAGTKVTSPANILSSKSTSDFFDSLDDLYDYVIIDTPPVNVTSDALYIAKYTDGIILTVKEKSTTHPMIKKAIYSFELIDVPILGFILNFSSKFSKNNYYNYYI